MVTPAAGPGDVSALMRSIQGGLKLKKAVTVDKSGPPVSGKVLGDTAPPAHINAAPRPVSPPARAPSPPMLDREDESSRSSNRQSVDWYAGLAADARAPVDRMPSLPAMAEEDYEEPYAPPPAHVSVPDIQVEDAAPDLMADIDKSTGA
jgi:hypothetical protein